MPVSARTRKLVRILTNKYLVVSAFFVLWMLFFDQRDVFQQREKRLELQKLETKKAYYEQAIESAKQELQDLQNSPQALEKFAREHYLMKRPGEDIYIIEDSLSDQK